MTDEHCHNDDNESPSSSSPSSSLLKRTLKDKNILSTVLLLRLC